MLTRIALTQIGLLLASDSFKSGPALADELVKPVFTGTTVQAWISGTLVDCRPTGWTIVTPWTVTFEAGHQVNAVAAIQTR